jgi:hypothetical protein
MLILFWQNQAQLIFLGLPLNSQKLWPGLTKCSVTPMYCKPHEPNQFGFRIHRQMPVKKMVDISVNVSVKGTIPDHFPKNTYLITIFKFVKYYCQ